MTKTRALQVLGALAAGIGFSTLAASHVFWHRGLRRISISLLATGATADILLLSSALIPNFPLTGRTFFRGDKAGNSVALTFDDGPRQPYTGHILDVLKQEAVTATFFVLGKNVRRYPDLVRRMEAEGHRVANHGMDHSILMWAGGREAAVQVRTTNEILRQAGVIDPAPLFRAPHGWLSPNAHREIGSLGYRVTGWTKGVWDTANPGVDRIVARTSEILAPGSILLLHDGWGEDTEEDRSQTAAALSGIIRQARERGLRFITVEEMIREKEGNV
jgi:peptidoglycan/xylan/chitin deacetylase (PgdA/CDA1 family)